MHTHAHARARLSNDIGSLFDDLSPKRKKMNDTDLHARTYRKATSQCIRRPRTGWTALYRMTPQCSRKTSRSTTRKCVGRSTSSWAWWTWLSCGQTETADCLWGNKRYSSHCSHQFSGKIHQLLTISQRSMFRILIICECEHISVLHFNDLRMGTNLVGITMKLPFSTTNLSFVDY